MNIQISYEPTATQLKFHETKFTDTFVDEVLFGGAVGGGKSMAIVMDAFSYAFEYPQSSILILRRTYPELQASIIDKCMEFYPADLYKYNSSDKVLTFLNGSKIKFGYLETERDMYRYQGAEYSAIYFDELTHFTKKAYDFLQSRLRNTRGYPNIIRASSNPIPFQQWVKDRFIDGDKLYIKSTLQDNPYLDTEDYEKRLQGLPDIEREALLNGNWDLSFGDVFKRDHFKVISYETYEAMINFEEDELWNLADGYTVSEIINFMVLDVAVTDEKHSDSSAFTIGTIDNQNNLYVTSTPSGKWLSNDLINKVFELARENDIQYIGIEDSAIAKTFIQNLESEIYKRGLPYVLILLKPKGRNKVARLQQYILSAVNQNRLYFVDKVDDELIQEAINFPSTKVHDDKLDSLAYFIEMGLEHLPQSGGLQNNISYTSQSYKITKGAW